MDRHMARWQAAFPRRALLAAGATQPGASAGANSSAGQGEQGAAVPAASTTHDEPQPATSTPLSDASEASALVAPALTAAQLYEKRLIARIMLLLSDAVWLVYTIGLFAKAVLALIVPLVKIGQTGQVTIDANALLMWGQLAAELVARLGDVLAKVFLIVSHGVAPI
jgi:hypothetical protein